MTTTTGDTPRRRPRPLAAAAGTLVAVLVGALAAALGFVVAGVLLGIGLVAANRLVQALIEHLAAGASPAMQLGAHGFSMLGRAFAVAITLFFVGAELTGTGADQPIGLDRPDIAGVALVIFALGFTTDIAVETLRRLGDHAHEKAQSTTTPEPAA